MENIELMDETLQDGKHRFEEINSLKMKGMIVSLFRVRFSSFKRIGNSNLGFSH